MNISVKKAEYVNKYKIKLIFNDGSVQIVNFLPFLKKHPHPQYNKYRDLDMFKQFKIEMGNIVWGENWDLIFDTMSLYNNDIFGIMTKNS